MDHLLPSQLEVYLRSFWPRGEGFGESSTSGSHKSLTSDGEQTLGLLWVS